MEQSNSLLLNVEALQQCADAKKPVFVYEWLRYLDRILPVTQKADIKAIQKKLIEQLTLQISSGCGAPTRNLLAKCIAQVYSIGDTYSLFETINFCNDTIKVRDDSLNQLPMKLAALSCLGAMYERLGRLVGRSYEESFQHMSRWLKSAESQGRSELLLTFAKMVKGLGSVGSSFHKDLYKIVKPHLTDRVPSVRVASIVCLTAMVSECPLLHSNEVETICTLCFRALELSNYEVRMAVVRLLVQLLCSAMDPASCARAPGAKLSSSVSMPMMKVMPNEEVFGILSNGFMRGGIGGFLKSSSSSVAGGHREVRIGVTLTYIELIKELGPSWLERNLSFTLKHFIDIMGKCGLMSSSMSSDSPATEVVFMRCCIIRILKSTIGVMFSEHLQISSCKQLGAFLSESINSFDYNTDASADSVVDAEVLASAEASIVILLELSCLVRQIGTAVTPLFVEASGIMEPIFACLLHPVTATRLSAAWCLRCASLSVSSQLTPLIDRCINRLEHMKVYGDAISGYSCALAALLTGSLECKLGIPHGKSKQVFTIAEDLIKTASQSSRITLVKIQAGWILIAAVLRLGRTSVQQCLQRLLSIYRNTFPRSVKEAENENSRGDSFTWACTLEARSGALASMAILAEHCAPLLSEDVIRKIVYYIECSLVTISHLPVLIRMYGQKLRGHMAMLRIHLYMTANRIPPKCYERSFSALLRELVADISLSDNAQSCSSSSLLTSLFPGLSRSLLGGWIKETDQASIEYEMNFSHPAVCGSIDNDAFSLVTNSVEDAEVWWPEPLSHCVSVIDCAILTFGRIYPLSSTKHKLKIAEHLCDCIKSTKNTKRSQAIQKNVLGCLLVAFKTTGELKGIRIDDEALQKANFNILLSFLSHSSAFFRCAAAEVLGRLAQAVGDAQFVAGMAQFSFDKLKSCRDAVNRTGFSLVLGCLHRHVGSLGSGQHLNTSVSILLALAQDNSSSLVQTWSIFALSLIADTGGGMFRGYVEPSLSLCTRLLLNTTAISVDVVQSVGKLITALITVVGPELQSVGVIEGTRTSFLIASSIMLNYSDHIVQAEAVQCLQQLHLFAPRFVHLDVLVKSLCILLSSSHLLLRKASVSCLRQLVQREAREVREHAQNLVPEGLMQSFGNSNALTILPENGLEGLLFSMLDTETHQRIRQDIKETIISLLQATGENLLSYWLSICKDILASSARSSMRDAMIVDDSNENGGGEDEDEKECVDDDATLQSAVSLGRVDKLKVVPRWPTRVFTTEIVKKIMSLCENERAHFDLALAKELQLSSVGRADYLVLHLSDLVRMSFMGATSDNTNLRLIGLSCLQDVITRFSSVPEPEFPGHVILEQFQAQVGAALRPAFASETPSDVTAAACQVCSTWIGSGVARDLNDLKRVHRLLVSSLNKLNHKSLNAQLYSESAATLEKLAILKAWAEVYIVAVEQHEKVDGDGRVSKDTGELSSESLLSLVAPELSSLVHYWLAVLRDSALLSLPPEFASQLPPEGGTYYTSASADFCKKYYSASWPPIILAAATWLRKNNFDIPNNPSASSDSGVVVENSCKTLHFFVLLGICIETLCSNRCYAEGDQTVQLCLRSLNILLNCNWSRMQLMSNPRIAIELMNVLYRNILTRDNIHTQRFCGEVALKVLDAAKFSMLLHRSKDVENGNTACEFENGYIGNEGVDNIKPGTSLAFATLEVSLCLLIRQIPQINSAAIKGKSPAALNFRKYSRLPPESNGLIKFSISILMRIPSLCSEEGLELILPSMLYLLLGVLRESSTLDREQLVPDAPIGHVSIAAAHAMQALRSILSDRSCEAESTKWTETMRRCLISLLNMASDSSIDHAVIMLATAVFITYAPRDVILGDKKSFKNSCAIFERCLFCETARVDIKCLQSLASIFARREICYVFIRELAPLILKRLRRFLLNDDGSAVEKVKELNEDEIHLIQEAMRVFEVTLSVARPFEELKIVNLLAQLLGTFLCDDPQSQYRELVSNSRNMHDFALTRLSAIGSSHSKFLRAILSAFPHLKAKMEKALRYRNAQATAAQRNRMASTVNLEHSNTNTVSVNEPTIKLRTDFSCFGASVALDS